MSQPVVEAKKKKSLISKILTRHGISGDVHEKICLDLENFVNHQTSNIQMLERRIETMTHEIDHYKVELEKNQEKMVKQSKMSTIGEVTATLSHEINNQLMALNANCELIELVNDTKLNNASITKSLSGVNSSMEEITKLIKNIRKFSFHSSNDNDHDLKYNLDSPVTLLNQALSVSHHMFKNNKMRLLVECPIDENLRTYVPSSELGQVLLNLLKNSFDHAMTLSLEDRWVKVEGSCSSDKIKFSIKNAGKIPEEVKEKLFQPFFTTKEIGKGTGIGLSLSKKILEGMNGRVFLEETEMNEICFSVEFPIYSEDPSIVENVSKPLKSAG